MRFTERIGEFIRSRGLEPTVVTGRFEDGSEKRTLCLRINSDEAVRNMLKREGAESASKRLLLPLREVE